MKSIRGRMIRKLKSISISISAFTSLNPSLLFHQLESSPQIPNKECDQRIDNNSPNNSLSDDDIFKDVEEKGGGGNHENGENDQYLNKEEQNGKKKFFQGPSFHQTPDMGFEQLREFEEKCPPGGNESVVFYTTSFRGIRKTFEDCSAIRFLLDSFRVVYEERDISMDSEYREELWKVLDRKVVPPRLFIRGRDIGGADEVVGLNEQGLLRKLFEGIPLIPTNRPCSGCAGVRFVLCLNCNGSRKIIPEAASPAPVPAAVRCLDCNENGLMKCPVCS